MKRNVERFVRINPLPSSADDFDARTFEKFDQQDVKNTFMLVNLLQKAFALWKDINLMVCEEPFEVMVKNKPVFDAQKLRLIRLQAFVDGDLECGVGVKYAQRRRFESDLLDTDTMYSSWNELAAQINSVVGRVNKSVWIESRTEYFDDLASTKKEISHNKPGECFRFFFSLLATLLIIDC